MNSMAPTRSIRARLAFVLGMALLAVLEIALLLYAHPRSSVLGATPLRSTGYEAATVDVASSLDSMARGGGRAGYDPVSSAGTLFGVDPERSTPALLGWTMALTRLGMPQVSSLSSFAWASALFAWLLVVVSAVVMRLSRVGIFTTAALALGLLNFDGLLRSAAFDGPPTFVLACALALLAITCAHRYSINGQLWALALGAAAALASGATHPGASLGLSVALLGLAAAQRHTKPHRRLAVVALIGLGLAGALPAVITALGAGVPPFGPAAGGTPVNLLTDLLGLVLDRRVSGSASLRTGVRVLAMGATVAATIWSVKKQDQRLGLAVAVLVPTALAYLGGLVPPVEHAFAYRGLALGLLGSAVLAGSFAQEIVESHQLQHLPRAVVLTLTVIGAALVPRLAQDIGYFVPELAPSPVDLPEEKPHIADMIGYGDIGYPRHRSFRHQAPPNDYIVITSKLAAVDGKARRILVESPSLAQYLRANTSAQVVGSLPFETTAQGADLFHRFPEKDPSEAKLRQYLETYAIGWIVVRFNPDPGDEEYRPRLAGLRSLLEPMPMKLAQHRVYRVREPAPYLAPSSGTVELDGDTIRVTGTDSQTDLTLRYHFEKHLQCRPGCNLEPLKIPGDAMGLIHIAAPHPADFEITARP